MRLEPTSTLSAGHEEALRSDAATFYVASTPVSLVEGANRIAFPLLHQDIQRLVASDPAPFIRAVRSGLRRPGGPGFAILRTKAFLSEAAGREVFARLEGVPAHQNGIYYLPARARLPSDGVKQPGGDLDAGQLATLMILGQWLERIVQSGMPEDERVRVQRELVLSNLRRQTPAVYLPETRHPDGMYLRCVGSLLDRGPVCLQGRKVPLERGDFLVFSGLQREALGGVKATEHESPAAIKERVLYALSFERAR
jgi:hypothetical protein